MSEEVEVVEGDHDERVAESAGGDQLPQLSDRYQLGVEIFGVVKGGGMAGFALFDEDGVAGVALDGGVGVDIP